MSAEGQIFLCPPFEGFAAVSKSARKTELTCHCEERGTSDVAIRISLGQTEYQVQ